MLRGEVMVKRLRRSKGDQAEGVKPLERPQGRFRGYKAEKKEDKSRLSAFVQVSKELQGKTPLKSGIKKKSVSEVASVQKAIGKRGFLSFKKKPGEIVGESIEELSSLLGKGEDPKAIITTLKGQLQLLPVKEKALVAEKLIKLLENPVYFGACKTLLNEVLELTDGIRDESAKRTAQRQMVSLLKSIAARPKDALLVTDLDLHGRLLLLDPEEKTEVLRAIAGLLNLESLDLSGNALTLLLEEVGELTKLKDLNLAKNQLGFLPGSIGFLGELERLDVSHNRLKGLPNIEIAGLTELRELNVESNELESLPRTLRYLSKLRKLNISNNQIKVTPWLQQLDFEVINLTKAGVGTKILTRFICRELKFDRKTGEIIAKNTGDLDVSKIRTIIKVIKLVTRRWGLGVKVYVKEMLTHKFSLKGDEVKLLKAERNHRHYDILELMMPVVLGRNLTANCRNIGKMYDLERKEDLAEAKKLFRQVMSEKKSFIEGSEDELQYCRLEGCCFGTTLDVLSQFFAMDPKDQTPEEFDKIVGCFKDGVSARAAGNQAVYQKMKERGPSPQDLKERLSGLSEQSIGTLEAISDEKSPRYYTAAQVSLLFQSMEEKENPPFSLNQCRTIRFLIGRFDEAYSLLESVHKKKAYAGDLGLEFMSQPLIEVIEGRKGSERGSIQRYEGTGEQYTRGGKLSKMWAEFVKETEEKLRNYYKTEIENLPTTHEDFEAKMEALEDEMIKIKTEMEALRAKMPPFPKTLEYIKAERETLGAEMDAKEDRLRELEKEEGLLLEMKKLEMAKARLEIRMHSLPDPKDQGALEARKKDLEENLKTDLETFEVIKDLLQLIYAFDETLVEEADSIGEVRDFMRLEALSNEALREALDSQGSLFGAEEKERAIYSLRGLDCKKVSEFGSVGLMRSDEEVFEKLDLLKPGKYYVTVFAEDGSHAIGYVKFEDGCGRIMDPDVGSIPCEKDIEDHREAFRALMRIHPPPKGGYDEGVNHRLVFREVTKL